MLNNKYIALFDLDNTIYNAHSFFQVVKWAIDKGRVSPETWTAVENVLNQYKKGELAFSVAANLLLELFSIALKGQKYTELSSDMHEFFNANRANFYPYFERILPALREKHDVYIVTTNFQYVADAVCKMFNLYGYISSEFEVVDGVLTGKVIKSLATGKDIVADLLNKYGRANSIAVGDSENDIAMFEKVEHPLCINPVPELKSIANSKGWTVCTDETIIETLQGILN